MRDRRRTLVAGAVVGLVAVLAPAAPSSAGRPGSYCATVEAPDDAFVDDLYRHALERCPYPNELDYWVGRLRAGPTRLTVVEAFSRSDGALDAVMGGAYGKGVGRAPTTAERTRWRADLRTHRDATLLYATIAASDELLAGEGFPTDPEERDRAWVDGRIEDVLGRPADTASVEYYVDSFGPGGSTEASRTRVGLVLARSIEGRRRTVYEAYSRALGRDPSPADVDFWAGWLGGVGRDSVLLLHSILVASPEGYARTQPPEGF